MSHHSGPAVSPPSPTPKSSTTADRCPSIGASSTTTSRAAGPGLRRSRRAGVLAAADVHAIVGGLEAIRAAVAARSRDCSTSAARRGRALVRRARTRRAHRRRRPPAAHGPLAQRTGLARLPALPEAAHSGGAGALCRRWSTRSSTRPSGRRGRHAVVHAPAARAARARRARVPGARGGVPARRRAVRHRALREADAMPLGSGAIAGTAYDVDVDWLAARARASRASWPTASTRRAIATSWRRSSTRARWRWCTSAGWPRT